MSDTFVEMTPSVVADNDPAVLREEVLRRMEVYVLELLHDLLPPPRQPSGQAAVPTRSRLSTSHFESTSTTSELEGGRGTNSATHHHVLSSSPITSSNLRMLNTTRRHLLLLRLLFANVQQSVVQTQRDVFYHLVREVPSQAMVNRTVQQLARVLRVPRQLMGVTAGGRGYVAGALCYRGSSLESPALACEGMPIPLLDADLSVTRVCEASDDAEGAGGQRGETHRRREGCFVALSSATTIHAASSTLHTGSPPSMSRTDEGFQIKSNVRFILVVEKHAVFAHLLREGLPRLIPCVLLTAQGFPTHAAHRLLANLHAAVPRAAVVGLVDYNPHGLAILAAYRWSSGGQGNAADAVSSSTHSCVPGWARMKAAMPESGFCAVAALRWLGVRAAQVHLVEGFTRQQTDGCGNAVQAAKTVAVMSSEADERFLHGEENRTRAGAGFGRTAEDSSGVALRKHGRDHGCNSAVSATSASLAASLFVLAKCPGTVAAATLTTATEGAVVPQPPMQPFTQRDSVVLDHLIAQLAARLENASKTQTCALQRAPAGDSEGPEKQKRQPQQSRDGDAAVHDTSASSDVDARFKQDADSASVFAWLREAQEMRGVAAKCELEVLYTHPYSALFDGSLSSARARSSLEVFKQRCDEGTAGTPGSFALWVAQQLLRGRYV